MKLKYMLLALMPLCMASCSEEETIVPVETQREVRVTAGADAQSRIVLSDQGNRVRSLWQNGDKISLFTSTQKGLVYSTEIEENAATAIFTPEDESLTNAEGNSVYACYPDVTLASGEEDLVVNLPSTETMVYDNGTIRSFGYAVGTIADDNLNLKFEHISAFLGLTLTPDSLRDATKAISSVKVVTSSDVPLSVGDEDTFDFSTRKATTTSGTNTVEINVDNLAIEDSWTVYIPLLPQPGGVNITVTLADSEGTVLYTRTKPTPEGGFLAGRVYMQGVYDKAYLIDGPTFNERIKELANEVVAGRGVNDEDNLIAKIVFVTNLPYTLPEQHATVSTSDSPTPIYATFNPTDSLLTVFTSAKDMEIVDASYMFTLLRKLHTVEFNQFGINEKTTNLRYMFYNCNSLVNLDVSDWVTSNVTDMGSMFRYCSSLTSLEVSNWNTSQVTDMGYMFASCCALSSLDVEEWDTGKVTNMGGMFIGCSSLSTLDVTKWVTSKVTDMGFMFYECSSLTTLSVANWDTSNVTDMDAMFSNCSSLETVNVKDWNVSKVTDMRAMFEGCEKLVKLEVADWKTESVRIMGQMFRYCSALKTLDISKWNVSSVEDMTYMFEDCSALSELDVSNWITTSLNDPGAMFKGCSKLTEINVSNWNTDEVYNIGEMFSGCSSLTSLDVSTWNTEYVRDMNRVFEKCSSLSTLDLSNWKVNNASDMDGIFADCNHLTQLNISNWSLNEEDNYWISGMFENCAATSQACRVTSSLATKEFLLDRTETISMTPAWFIWDGSSYEDMPNQDW